MSEQPGNSFLYLADALSSEEYLVHATTDVAEQIKMAVLVLKQAQETVFEDTNLHNNGPLQFMENGTKLEGLKVGSEIFRVEKGRIEILNQIDQLGNPICIVTLNMSPELDILKSYRPSHLKLLPRITFVLDPSTDKLSELVVERTLHKVDGVLSAIERVVLLPETRTSKRSIHFIPETPDTNQRSLLLIDYDTSSAVGTVFREFTVDNQIVCFLDRYVITGESITRDNTAENILHELIKKDDSLIQSKILYPKGVPKILPFSSIFTDSSMKATVDFKQFEMEINPASIGAQQIKEHLKKISLQSIIPGDEFDLKNIDLSEVTVIAMNDRQGFEVKFNLPSNSSRVPLTTVLGLSRDLRIIKLELDIIK